MVHPIFSPWLSFLRTNLNTSNVMVHLILLIEFKTNKPLFKYI